MEQNKTCNNFDMGGSATGSEPGGVQAAAGLGSPSILVVHLLPGPGEGERSLPLSRVEAPRPDV